MDRVALGCIGIRDMDKNKMYRDNIFKPTRVTGNL
jgi:hypothetical protein